jgi:hypothetical protein
MAPMASVKLLGRHAGPLLAHRLLELLGRHEGHAVDHPEIGRAQDQIEQGADDQQGPGAPRPRQQHQEAGQGIEQQDVPVPEGDSVDQPDQPQPEQARSQQTAARLVAALAADQEDRDAEQHGEQGPHLVAEEDVMDQPAGDGVGVPARLQRGRGQHAVRPEEGHGIDRQNAQDRQAAHDVKAENPVRPGHRRQYRGGCRGLGHRRPFEVDQVLSPTASPC